MGNLDTSSLFTVERLSHIDGVVSNTTDPTTALTEQNLAKGPIEAPWQVDRDTLIFHFDSPTGPSPGRLDKESKNAMDAFSAAKSWLIHFSALVSRARERMPRPGNRYLYDSGKMSIGVAVAANGNGEISVSMPIGSGTYIWHSIKSEEEAHEYISEAIKYSHLRSLERTETEAYIRERLEYILSQLQSPIASTSTSVHTPTADTMPSASTEGLCPSEDDACWSDEDPDSP